MNINPTLSSNAMGTYRCLLLVIAVQVLILFLIQCVVATQQQVVPLSSTIERSALLDLRSSLGIRAKDWPVRSDPCRYWTGVQCLNGRVTGINLSGMKRTRVGRLNPRFNVDSLSNFTLLISFNASQFSLPGQIPDWFGYSLGALQVLDLRSSSVSGSIPASLGNLTKLHSLYLSGNNLAGNIPDSLGQLKNLTVVDLSSNSLTGPIPSSLSSLENIERLELSSNYLSGSIPVALGSVCGLQFLNLSDNSLTGLVPGQFGNLSRLIQFDFSKNSLTGSLPVNLRGLWSLQVMKIGDNGLEGPLPGGLFTSLDQLEVVDLSGNRLDGSLPNALFSLPNLRVLDVSRNNFTGSLSIVRLKGNTTSATVFNLSNNLFYGNLDASIWKYGLVDLSGNYIQGKVPGDGPSNARVNRNCLQDVPHQRSLEDCRMFCAVRGLKCDNFGALEPTQSSLPKAKSKSKHWIFILAGLFAGLGFIVLLVSVLVLILRRGGKVITNQRGSANVGPVPEGDSPQIPEDPIIVSGIGESFKYELLHQSTGEFSATNFIRHGHSGDFFQGILEGGTPIVVKKVDLSSFKKESYMVELDVFSKASHTRLVPLLGHCLEHESEKLLVYKYMPNGDLASSLHSVPNSEDDGLKSLDWITRLKIATGAAEGLSYLHHECTPPLVHRDVQASSILLDDKYEVRLGSLSEVLEQEGDPRQNVLTRLFRKPATSEPGPSGSSSATCAYDVYCFGKVLLVLVTGKLGISKLDDEATREWLDHTLAYINSYDKELVTKILDPSLIIDDDLLEEVWAMAIVARSCLNPKPYKRPPMKYILKALENPLKVVREESFNSGRLRTTSSRRSWSAAFFGSWRQSSSESATVLGHTNREGVGGLKQSDRIDSHGSGRVEHSTLNKRLSNEIFPEPVEMQDGE
ncbi:LRR_1 domain-containing protein/Pkinase_Tyr domain-containing protein/LRRNT_2 domain-containing protein/LRR_4 domain-containing protein, partial [Cephalotus follicularis]